MLVNEEKRRLHFGHNSEKFVKSTRLIDYVIYQKQYIIGKTIIIIYCTQNIDYISKNTY